MGFCLIERFEEDSHLFYRRGLPLAAHRTRSTFLNPSSFIQGAELHRLHNKGPKAIGKSFRTPRWRPIVTRFHSGCPPSLHSLMYARGQGHL